MANNYKILLALIFIFSPSTAYSVSMCMDPMLVKIVDRCGIRVCAYKLACRGFGEGTVGGEAYCPLLDASTCAPYSECMIPSSKIDISRREREKEFDEEFQCKKVKLLIERRKYSSRLDKFLAIHALTKRQLGLRLIKYNPKQMSRAVR